MKAVYEYKRQRLAPRVFVAKIVSNFKCHPFVQGLTPISPKFGNFGEEVAQSWFEKLALEDPVV